MAGTKAPRRKALKAPKSKENQTYIEGTEPLRIAAIEDGAAEYVDSRDARMGMLAEELRHRERLIAAMKEHGLETYNFDGYVVQLSHVDEDQVKVKRARAAKETNP